MSLNDVFRLLDWDNKGYLSATDLESTLIDGNGKRSQELIEDVDLLVSLFDRNMTRKISYLSFLDELTPKLQ
jgi:Ca2+-binding EF-hand superfamily protein